MTSYVSFNRRQFLGTSLAASGLALSVGSAWGQDKPDSMVYSTFGGDYGGWYKAAYEDPFTAETGIKLVHDIGANPERLAKLRAYRDKPRFHVIGLQDRFLHEATAAGLLEEIDYSNVPNAAKLSSVFKKPTWVGSGYLSIGMIYHADRVKEPLRNWDDLLNDKYKGKIFIDDFDHFGLQMVVAVSFAKGGGYDNIRPGLEFVKQIKERLNPRFISTSQEGTKLLREEAVDVAMWQNTRAFLAKRQGKPYEYAIPETGDVPVVHGNGVVKGTGMKKWCEQFLNSTTNPKLQAQFASGVVPTTPSHPDALDFADSAVKQLLTRPTGAKQFEIDYGEVSPRLASWTKLWNEMISS